MCVTAVSRLSLTEAVVQVDVYSFKNDGVRLWLSSP